MSYPRFRRSLESVVAAARSAAAALRLTGTTPAHAQSATAHSPQRAPTIDLAVTYISQRSLEASNSESFWSRGGSIELGADVWRGLGIAMDVTGTHADSIGSSQVPLSLVTATFGPRYRWHRDHRLSVYAQALAGEANGFDSLFPSQASLVTSANNVTLQIGGGVDLSLRRHLAIRAIDAGWLRTQLPNGTDDIQNSLRLGAGLVVRFH